MNINLQFSPTIWKILNGNFVTFEAVLYYNCSYMLQSLWLLTPCYFCTSSTFASMLLGELQTWLSVLLWALSLHWSIKMCIHLSVTITKFTKFTNLIVTCSRGSFFPWEITLFLLNHFFNHYAFWCDNLFFFYGRVICKVTIVQLLPVAGGL